MFFLVLRELTFEQSDLLEVEGDVVLLGEDINGAAGLGVQIQVQLYSHDFGCLLHSCGHQRSLCGRDCSSPSYWLAFQA